ncbi:urease accessory protein UreF [Antrihabitans cavernicola]|uniref:Urease accessory protein UreF n=1 Tax=Antrihabitans cavernicola TaxID=2495913 RepID=A0A5A7S6H0_9NOCA|nr:urease accessory UreF family protein [Spelaeibacter cavernicola]KAA0019486.1 urease accessory protein [Spelaeibacter cavernicola]
MSGLDALLVSLQLSDSAFPSGFYTLSHGLEGYAQAKAIDAESLPRLLADLLRHSVGPSDATALALAHRAALGGDWETVIAVDRRLQAAKLNREVSVAATRTGQQMLDVAQETFGGPMIAHYWNLVTAKRVPCCQAVAAGIVYAGTGVSAERAVASDLFAFSASFVGAAMRLRLTDHRIAQVLLRQAADVITEVTAEALVRELADLGGCVPIADVMSGMHERAEARLFAT